VLVITVAFAVLVTLISNIHILLIKLMLKLNLGLQHDREGKLTHFGLLRLDSHHSL
jgi:hypothetical protein